MNILNRKLIQHQNYQVLGVFNTWKEAIKMAHWYKKLNKRNKWYIEIKNSLNPLYNQRKYILYIKKGRT